MQHRPCNVSEIAMNSQATLLALSLSLLGGCSTLPATHATNSTSSGTIMHSTQYATAHRQSFVPLQAIDIIQFWEDAGPDMWFAKDAAFDQKFRERYASLYAAAMRGELNDWRGTAAGSLALVLLLDQYPRNSFRNTPKMYASDTLAREVADAAIAAGYGQAIAPELQIFFVLPFVHSELLADQERAVNMARQIGPDPLAHAEHHRDIIKRFGRFPHRNSILGRASTPEELHYLQNGGYAG